MSESPKVGARRFRKHCCNALAKSLGPQAARTRREELSAALLAKPAFEQWVQAVEIVYPDSQIRLKAGRQAVQVVREVLVAGEAYGRQPATGEKTQVEFVSAEPDRPTACGLPPGGRKGCHLVSCAPAGRCGTASSVTTTPAFRFDATRSVQMRSRGLKPATLSIGRAAKKVVAYNGDYIADIAEGLQGKEDREIEDRAVTAGRRRRH